MVENFLGENCRDVLKEIDASRISGFQKKKKNFFSSRLAGITDKLELTR
jgi:hypothetical protein